MLDLRRVIHREIHPQVREASPDLKRAITDGLSTPPVTPEFQFHLPGGRAASPKNLFVLARPPEGLAVLVAEGKCAERFRSQVSVRYTKPSAGKTMRLKLKTVQVQTIGHQLMHSATAQRFHAARAGCWFIRSVKPANGCRLTILPKSLPSCTTRHNPSGRPLRRIDFYSGWGRMRPNTFHRRNRGSKKMRVLRTL